MNAEKFRALFQHQNLTPLVLALLFSLVVVWGFVSSMAQSSAEASVVNGRGNQLPPEFANTKPEDIEKEFNDDDLKAEKPRGKWGFGLLFDMSQFDDPSVPVVVGGIQSLSGGGKYLGVVKIKRVGIKNRSSKIVSSIQLKWTLAPLDNPEKVLSQGTTQFANVWVEANSSQVIEIPTLYPALLLKSLAKDGELNGRFRLTIGVQEARFADGTFWRRQEPVAFLKFVYLDRSLDSHFPALASTVLGTAPLLG